jgi:hypothetical protein
MKTFQRIDPTSSMFARFITWFNVCKIRKYPQSQICKKQLIRKQILQKSKQNTPIMQQSQLLKFNQVFREQKKKIGKQIASGSIGQVHFIQNQTPQVKTIQQVLKTPDSPQQILKRIHFDIIQKYKRKI